MFIWDEPKRVKVLEKHKVDLALIVDAFDDSYGVYFEDVEHSTDDETRFNLIAFCPQYGLVYVTFTYTENDTHLITARKAERWAVKEYEKYKSEGL